MAGCQHCENLAAEVRETRSVVEHLVAEIAATRAVVEGMQKTLLGNGQPGRCAEHGVRIARLERWRSWIAGALAVIGVLWVAAVTVFAAVIAERTKH
jgi:t-SNARE complex subunit (syntaxin)